MSLTPLELLSAVSNFATALGVAVAASQLFATRRQALTSFEDSLNSQYRAVIERIPMEALLGEPVRGAELIGLLPHFYRYFDLCNEQAFLFKRERVSENTWKNWEEGIASNLSRPAFAAAWSEIARRAPSDFDYLRALCPPATTQTKEMA
jgi:hypothetical protein